MAYYLAMEKGKPGDLYLIGSEQIYTIKECLEMLINLSLVKDKIQYQIDQSRVRPTELNILVGKFDKFHNLTGWKPEIPFQETLKSILDYWREFVEKGYY